MGFVLDTNNDSFFLPDPTDVHFPNIVSLNLTRQFTKKVKLTLEQATKAQRGVEVQLEYFFNFGARWGGWSTVRPGRFTPGKETGTHSIGGWVNRWAGLDGCEKSRHHRDSIPGPSSP
jgi:hypothetical protein